MPRSNSNYLASGIHILFFATLFITCPPIQRIALAQGTQTDESTVQDSAEEKAPEASSPIVDLIKSSQNKKTSMRSMNWSNKKYKDKIAKEKGEEDESNTESEEETETETEEEKTTGDLEDEQTDESKRIWEHYNNLAKRIKEKKEEEKTDKPKKDKNEEETAKTEAKEDDKKESKEDEVKEEEQEPASTGLTDILQRYKKTQKEQGPMNSRSFGSID